MNKQDILEGLKSGARVAIFAFVGALIAYVTGLPQNNTTMVVLLVLKVVDKAVHESKFDINGLLPF